MINPFKDLAKKADYLFNKVLPKKFIVFCVCTYIVLQKIVVPPEYWEIVKYYLIGGSLMSTTNTVMKNLNKTTTEDKTEGL